MTPREIIAKAWGITRKQRSIRWWGYTSSFFETLLHLKMLVYQVYFFWSYVISGNTIGLFEIEEIIYRYVPFGVFVTIVAVFLVLLIIEVFIPSLCLGAIIGLGAKSYRKEEVKGGLVLALYNFFPLFVIKEVLVLSSVSIAITFTSIILRYGGGPGMITFLLGALWFLWLFSIILRFFLSFAEESAVIRKTGIFESMGKSFKLVISHLGKIVFLIVLLFVISLRIIINALMALLLPGIIIGFAFLFSLFLSATLTAILTSIVGLVLVGLASYLFAYLEVFKQTAWTITFLELSKLKEMDIIEG
jgi:hypothetical protein